MSRFAGRVARATGERFSAPTARAKLGLMSSGPRSRDEREAALARLEVFSALNEQERTGVAELARLRNYAKGRTLLTQGSEAESTYGIVAGRLRVSLSRADGSEATLTILGPGELFGELGLFQDGTRSARITALEDVRVLSVGKQDLLRTLERSPAASLALCRLLASRVRQLAQHFEDVTALPAEQRLARKLVFLAERWGAPTSGGLSIGLQLSQRELAELADTSRQTTNKCFAKWRKAGILHSTSGKLVIRDRSRLERCADGAPPRNVAISSK